MSDRNEHQGMPEWQTERYTQLLDALTGVSLSGDERRILRWLAGWETSTVDTFAEVIRKAREAGPA